MAYETKDMHGRPIILGTDHEHVTITVGDRTAELTGHAAGVIRERLFDEETDARRHACGDCAREA